jgi:hypothetical protein
MKKIVLVEVRAMSCLFLSLRGVVGGIGIGIGVGIGIGMGTPNE